MTVPMQRGLRPRGLRLTVYGAILTTVVCAPLLMLTACPPPNVAPTASAGEDQIVNAGDLVTLDGSASRDNDSDAITFSWKQTAGGEVTLSSATDAVVTFTAPSTGAALVFELTVDDGQSRSTSLTTVSVRPPANEAVEIAELSQPSINDDPAVNGKFPAGFTLSTDLEGESEEDESGAASWAIETTYGQPAEVDLAPGASRTVTLEVAGKAILVGSVKWIGTTGALDIALALDGSVLSNGESYSVGNDRGGNTLRVQIEAGGRATLTVKNSSGAKVTAKIYLGAFTL